jgi:hypothetical protein
MVLCVAQVGDEVETVGMTGGAIKARRVRVRVCFV